MLNKKIRSPLLGREVIEYYTLSLPSKLPSTTDMRISKEGAPNTPSGPLTDRTSKVDPGKWNRPRGIPAELKMY